MVKVDVLGQTFSMERKKTSPMKTAGAPGFAVYGGYLDNKEKVGALTGQQRYTTFNNNLINTAIIGAGVRHFLNLVAKAEWAARVPKGMEKSAEAKEMVDFVMSVLDDMDTSWHRVVRKTALYRFHGFSLQEWTLKRRAQDSAIGFLQCAARPQTTIVKWDTDPHGNVLGVVQENPQNSQEIYLDRAKLVYAVDDSISDIPEGIGLFRHIVEVTNRLRTYEKLEGIGYESDLSGVPYARIPLEELNEKLKNDEITQDQYNAAILPIQTFMENHIRQKNTGIALDSGTYRGTGEQQTPVNSPKWDIQLLSAAVTSSEQINGAIERCNREIARVLGVEQMLLGEGNSGSHALSRDKSNSLYLQVGSTLKELAETYERDLINPLWERNGFDPALKPSLTTEEIAQVDLQDIASSLRDIASATGPLDYNDDAVREFFELAGLTPPERDEADLGGDDLNANPSDEPEEDE